MVRLLYRYSITAINFHLPDFPVSNNDLNEMIGIKSDVSGIRFSCKAGPHYNIRSDVLSWDLVKSRSRETGSLNNRMALKFERHINRSTAEMLVKFQSDRTIVDTNLTESRLHEILH